MFTDVRCSGAQASVATYGTPAAFLPLVNILAGDRRGWLGLPLTVAFRLPLLVDRQGAQTDLIGLWALVAVDGLSSAIPVLRVRAAEELAVPADANGVARHRLKGGADGEEVPTL